MNLCRKNHCRAETVKVSGANAKSNRTTIKTDFQEHDTNQTPMVVLYVGAALCWRKLVSLASTIAYPGNNY